MPSSASTVLIAVLPSSLINWNTSMPIYGDSFDTAMRQRRCPVGQLLFMMVSPLDPVIVLPIPLHEVPSYTCMVCVSVFHQSWPTIGLTGLLLLAKFSSR